MLQGVESLLYHLQYLALKRSVDIGQPPQPTESYVMCAAWTVVRKRASISALYCVLECLLSTPCLHLQSFHATRRATDLVNVCFLEAVLPENCGPTLSVWQPQPSLGFVHVQTANILTQCCHLACVGLFCLSSSL
jgi:hypothetical protein